MIIFSGWGLITPVIGAIGLIVGVWSAQAVQGEAADPAVAVTVAGCFAAALCWWFGSWINDPKRGRVVVDKLSGKEIHLRTRHSLMFIPIQYYALLYLAVAVCGMWTLM